MLKCSQGQTSQTFRSHAFINRTQTTCISVINRKWEDVGKAIKSGFNLRGGEEGKIKAIRVEDCSYEDYMKEKGREKNESVEMVIPEGLTRIGIVKCQLLNLNIRDGKCMFGNLEELDLSHNRLSDFPIFLEKCPKLVSLNLSSNKIKEIPLFVSQLQTLKFVSLQNNQIELISCHFYDKIINKQVVLEIEWRAEFLGIDDEQSIPSMRTTEDDCMMTERSELKNIDFEFQNEKNTDFINLKDKVSNNIRTFLYKNSQSSLQKVGDQIESLLMCENISYVEYIEEFIKEEKCKQLIDVCLKNRKYSALDYLLILLPKLQKNKKQKQTSKVLKLETGFKRSRENKENHELECPVDFKLETPTFMPNNKRGTKKITTEKICFEKYVRCEFLLNKLVTFNPFHYSSLSQQDLINVKFEEFVWLLNEMEFLPESKGIKEIMCCEQFQKLAQNILIGEREIEDLLNCVGEKKILQFLFCYCDINVFEEYNFENLFITKSILLLEDFDVLRKFTCKYVKFASRIFNPHQAETQNVLTRRSENLNSNQSNFNIKIEKLESNVSEVSSSAPFWKTVIYPNYKTYKFLFKKYKSYLLKQLSSNENKSWHFPEYNHARSVHENLIPKYSNETLKEYEEFQTNLGAKAMKVKSKLDNKDHEVSISKKIYMEILDECKNSVRSIGKSRGKFKNIKEFSDQSVGQLKENSTWAQNKNLANSVSKLKSPHKNGKYHINKNTIKVISIKSKDVSVGKENKKVGISLCNSSSKNSQKFLQLNMTQTKPKIKQNYKERFEGKENEQKVWTKAVYLDLSEKQNTFEDESNLEELSEMKQQNEVFECSNFDSDSL